MFFSRSIIRVCFTNYCFVDYKATFAKMYLWPHLESFYVAPCTFVHPGLTFEIYALLCFCVIAFHTCWGSGVVANLELREHSEVFFPSPWTSPFLYYSLSLPTPLFPCPSFPFFLLSLSLEVGSLNTARDRGSAVSSSTGSRTKPQPKSNLVHFSFQIWHPVAAISMIFLRINLP